MTQNDLYIAQAYGHIDGLSGKMTFTYSGDIFDNINELQDKSYYKFGSNDFNIYQFGIQTVPGVEIQLNDNGGNVKVGQTGIWEINLSSLTPISSAVKIYKLDQLLGKEDNKDGLSCNYCLIDVIYSKNQTGGVTE